MMRCPKCNGEVLVTVTANDSTGENITSKYHCSSCNIELAENEILNDENTEELNDFIKC